MNTSLLFFMAPIIGFILLFFPKWRLWGVILIAAPVLLIFFVFMWGCGAD